MGVRNLQEFGINLQKIVRSLLNNENLVRLLYYTDMDPLGDDKDFSLLDVSTDVYEKLIRIVPKIGTKDNEQSIIAIYATKGYGLSENNEYHQININIDVYTPLTQWIIKDSNLRPFAIMGQIQKSLNNKTVNGLGKLKCGDFDLSFVTEDVSCYKMLISVIEYD